MAKLAKKSATSGSKDFHNTVAQIEEENRARMSDAVTSEDGVVYDEPMLAGYEDEDGVRHTTFAYRETNGHDEEAINKVLDNILFHLIMMIKIIYKFF